MENEIKIILWGVRGSTPCANSENMQYGGNTTCVQVEIPSQKELLVFDCGTGLRNLGNALQTIEEDTKGRIFITHPHWDHLQGFPFFKPFYDQKNWFRIYLPPQGEMGCQEILQGHMSKTFFPVSMDMLQADIDCENFQTGKKLFEHYSMEYMWANHTVPTAIYKLRIQDQTIVFAPDNEIHDTRETDSGNQFNSRLCKFLEDVDLLIHDAQYSMREYQMKEGWGHSAWEFAIDIAQQAGVKQLCLTHHDPDHSDGVLARVEHTIMKEHADKFEKIWLAKEGQVITLPSVKSDKMSVN